MGSAPGDPDTPGAGAMFSLQDQEVSWEGGYGENETWGLQNQP